MSKRARIVVLDGYTLNPGDLSWNELEELGDVALYDRTPERHVALRAQDADIVLTNKVPLTAEVIEALPHLRYIGVMATGYNVVDLDAANGRGIVVTNVPGYGTQSVAQFTFGLILELCHRIEQHSHAVREGAWSRNPDFCFTLSPQVELAGKTLGIVGYGSIGSRVAQLGLAFGMDVLVSSRTRKETPNAEIHWTDDLETLLRDSDVVSLHCPLTDETAKLIRRETLNVMKSSALLINTSRGGLVMEEDLADALNQERIAGAAVDVLSHEPPTQGSPLLTARNCIVTPHIAWASREARSRLMSILVENVRGFQAGRPVNVVG